MKIAVYGSAHDYDPGNVEKARELGREIARRHHILITGACPGLPYEAVLGANEYKGVVIGFSPGLSLDDHIQRFQFPTKGFTDLRFIPDSFPYLDNKVVCFNLRNVFSAAESEAVVIIEGSVGTLGEFVNSYKAGIPIGVSSGTGGLTDYIHEIIEKLKKPKSKTIYYGNPVLLLNNLEKIVQQ